MSQSAPKSSLKASAYPTLDSLFDLACRDGVDIRPTLLRVLTDLYVQKPAHSADEEAQYVELALGLIEAVDQSTRAAVAASMAAYSAAPAAILRRLTRNGSSAASDIPAQTAAEADHLVELFFAAGTEERRLILTNLHLAGVAIPRRSPPASGEVIRRLEAAALQHNTGEFSRMLERALGINRELAERATRDPSGEPIVVAAKALGMTAAVLQRVLLCLNPVIGQSTGRVYDLASLFDEITLQAAEHMLAIWRKGAKPARPMHQPPHWDDERRGARSLASPAAHRVERGSEQQPSRIKTTGR